MRRATSSFLKSLSAPRRLEKANKVLITHLGGEWKCGSCGKTQGYDDYTCAGCGHDSAGPKSKHIFTKDHVNWYHAMEAKEAEKMPSMAKSLGAREFLGTLQKSLQCVNGHDDTGAGDHAPRPATHIARDFEGSLHPVCEECVKYRRIIGRGLIYGEAKPIVYGEPTRHLHPDVASSAKITRFIRDEKVRRDGRHTGGNGPIEKALTKFYEADLKKYLPCNFSHYRQDNGSLQGGRHYPRPATHVVNYKGADTPVCAHCAQAVEEHSYVHGYSPDSRQITYGTSDHENWEVQHLASLRRQKFGKSLGYQGLIDELRKSPRRTLKHPPEGMPETMHASWHAYNGVPQATMKQWKEPSHEMHHAYLAKEWVRKNTNLKRYGTANPSQNDPAWLSSEAGKKWSAEKQGAEDHLSRIASEHREHMARINAHESMKHVPGHVAASREAYIKEKTSAHDANGVRVGGVAHLSYEHGNDVINALGKYHRAGKMSEKEHLRTQNFKENFHDFMDSHEEHTGSYEGAQYPVVHVHPAMLELAHRAMQAHSTNPQAKSIIRHANDAAELHKP